MWLALDIIVLAIFIVCIYIGVTKGFVRAAYQILSVIAAIAIVFAFRAQTEEFLSSTQIGQTVRENVASAVDTILANSSDSESASDVVSGLHLPNFISENINTGLQSVESARDNISNSLTVSITDSILSSAAVILLFLIARLVLWVLIKVLDIVFKLPVLNFVNKSAGAAMGFINALLIIYIACAALTFILPMDNMSDLGDALNRTMLAKYFYENNFLMELFMK